MEQNRVWADVSVAESVIYSLRNYFLKQPISIGPICAVSGKRIYEFVIVHSLKRWNKIVKTASKIFCALTPSMHPSHTL